MVTFSPGCHLALQPAVAAGRGRACTKQPANYSNVLPATPPSCAACCGCWSRASLHQTTCQLFRRVSCNSSLLHSLLWMLVEGEPWSPADHRYWPPAFKAAARTLLLAHRRGAPVKRRSGSPTRAAAVERQVRFGFCFLVVPAAAAAALLVMRGSLADLRKFRPMPFGPPSLECTGPKSHPPSPPRPLPPSLARLAHLPLARLD